ncbi:putative reverse transcriptase domain-containing protein [Tanacetum coccineum]
MRMVKSIPPKCHLGFSQVLKGAFDKVICKPDDIACWVSLLVLPLCLLKTFCPRSNLECKSANRRQRQEESITNAIRSWGVPGGSLQLVKETLAKSASPMLDLDKEDFDLNEQNLKQCKRKICDGHYTTAVRGTSCGRDVLRAQHLMDCLSGAAVAISDDLVSSITQVVNLFLEGKCPMMLGEYIASALLTPLVKPGGGIRPIAVGIFGVEVPRGGEAILHAVNRLVKDRGDDVGHSMLLMDFQNAFNLVDRTIMLEEVRLRCPAISRWVEFCYSSPARLYYGEHSLWSCQGVQQGDPLGSFLFSLVLHPLICKIRDSFNLCLQAWYLDDGTIVRDTLVVGKVLELITEDGPRCGLHLNVDKTELFWPKEDPRSRLEGVFPPNISRPLHGVKLLGGPVSVEADFSSALVMKRVSKTIGLLDAVAKINDPQCELLLIRACAGISKLYFAMRTCPPRIFESAQLSFDMALRSALERDVLNYAFIASRLQSAALQTKLLRHVGIVDPGSTFDVALCMFNNAMEIDFLSNPNGLVVISKGRTYFGLASCGSDLWFGTDNEWDVYGDHAVSCAGVIGIKHRHNAVRDTLVDICFRSGISAGKKVDIGLGGGCDKALRPADMLLYSWEGGLDVCVDLTGSSPLTQTGMADFVPGRAMIDAAQRKRGKYMAKCPDIGYGFLPFSFSSFGELEKDALGMVVVRFHCPFVGLNGCYDGGGDGLTKTSLITHLRDRHCNGDAQAITRKTLSTNLAVFEEAEGSDFVSPPNCGDGVVRFVLYDIIKPHVPTSSEQLDHVDDLVQVQHEGFTLALLDSLFSKGLRTVKSIPPKCRLGFSLVLKNALDKAICTPDDISCWVSLLVLPLCLLKTFHPRSNLECKSAIKRKRQKESIVNAIRSWSLPGGSLQVMRETLAESSPLLSDVDEEHIDLDEWNIKQCKRKICDGHYNAVVRVLSSSGVAPYNDATLEDLKTKHPFKPPPSLPHMSIDHHHLVASPAVVLERIKSFPRGTSCGRDGLRAQHLMDCLSGAVVAISDKLVFSITQVVNLFLNGKYPNRLGEYIASAPLSPLVKPGGGIRPIAMGTVWRRLISKVSAIMIGHSLDGYLDGLQFGVGVAGGSEAILHFVNRLIEACGDDVGLSMLLVDFKNAFNLVNREVMLREVRLRCPAISRWVEFCYSNPTRLYYEEHTLWSCQGVQQGDPLGPLLFSLVLHPLICKIRNSFSLSLHAWYLDDGTIVGDTMVVGKVLELIMEDGSWCGLHLNVDKTKVFCPKEDPRSRLAGIFPPNIARPLHGVKLLSGPASVDFDFCNELVMKRVAKTIRLMDAIAKINDRQFKLLLLRSCTGISRLYFTMRICPPLVFESAQRSFDVALRSSLERIVTASGPGFGDWKWRLATLPFAFGGLGVYSAGDVLNYAFLASRLQSAALQTKLFLAYCYCIPLFSVSKPCLACSRVFAGNIYGDHAVSCAGIIGITHCHNVVRDTLVDICYRSGISAGKEVDIGLDGGRDKPLRPADVLLYSWDVGLDVCVDLTGSSPLTQTGMVDFVPDREHGKYIFKCAAIGFLPFSFSSLGELEADAVTLLKRIRKFSMAQDIGTRAAIHIFNRISFAIAKG